MLNARRSALFTLVFLTIPAATLCAQTCYGTAPRGGIAVDHGKVGFGTTTGVTGALAGDHFAVGAGYRTLDHGRSTTGNAEQLRFALIVGGGSFQICPGLGFEFERSAWKVPQGTLNSTSLTGWGGVGVGYEQRVYDDFRVIPFVGLRFAFTATKYDYAATGSGDVKTTGDTLSGGQMQYGLLGRYKIVYAGFIADRPLKSAPPFLARYVLGLTFPAKE